MGNAKLKTLPPDRQAQIAEYGAQHTLDATVAWLKEDGVASSRTALSEFLSWWSVREDLKRNELVTAELVETMRARHPEWSADDLFMAGQTFFTELAIAEKDSKMWKNAQNAMIDREKVALLRERLATQAEKAKGVMEDESLSPEQRQARMREIFGMA